MFYTSQVLMSVAGNDATLTFSRPHPAVLPPYGEPAPFALVDVVAVLQMSIGSLKDLGLLITQQILAYEEKTKTVIETEFTRKMAQEQ